jgi:hypothetical protein
MTILSIIAERLRLWSLRLPRGWNVDHIEINPGLLVSIPALAAALAFLSFASPSWSELRTASVTLPLVMLGSLIVRIAAQQLALGAHANRFETAVGPVGNLSNDYERLEGPLMFSYGIAGQIATASLVILGFVVSAAVEPASQTNIALVDLFDFKSGWNSRAWASQILWFNMFLSAIHILPTYPFDSRAVVYACCKIYHRKMDQARIYRWLGSVDTHLACLFLGISLAGFTLEWLQPNFITGWYVFLILGVYLVIGGRWENTQAAELAEEILPMEPVSVMRRDTAHARKPDSHFGLGDHSGAGNTSSKELGYLAPPDLDEILRKLHRDGRESLSAQEKEALLSASRRLREKRNRG